MESFLKVSGTFNDKRLSQQAKMIGRLVFTCQFLQSHPGTHSLGIPIPALHVVHFGHQQQSLVQVPGLEDEKKELTEVKQISAIMVSVQPSFVVLKNGI